MIVGSMWISPKVFPNIDGKVKVVWKFLMMKKKKIENKITKVIMISEIIKNDHQEIVVRCRRSRNENVPDQGNARRKKDHDQGNNMIENVRDRVIAIAKNQDRVQEIVKEKKDLGQGNITEEDLDQETVIIIIMEINMIEKDRDHVQEIGIANGNGIKDTARVIGNPPCPPSNEGPGNPVGIKNRK